jgi:hypothetical protein
MLGSPWDQQEIRLLRDDGEREIVGIDVRMSDDPSDDRFAIGFQTSDGRTLQVRMPADQLVRLGTLLLRLAEEQPPVGRREDDSQ